MTAVKKSKKLPTVPETLLKKRKREAEIRKKRIELKGKSRKNAVAKHREIFKRAESYVRDYRQQQRDKIRLHRLARGQGSFHVEPEARLAFVVRIRGVNQVHPRARKVLQLFRLLQINNGVFVKLNKATLNMLRICEPFIAWGYPSMKTVHDVMYKRAHAKIDGRRVPITSNTVIEKKLGKYDMICMEDLVHQIYNVGPYFKQATTFLWPFKLNTPNGGWTSKTTHFVEGGDFGNREEKINALLRRMI